jgi:hypothetical protein
MGLKLLPVAWFLLCGALGGAGAAAALSVLLSAQLCAAAPAAVPRIHLSASAASEVWELTDNFGYQATADFSSPTSTIPL